MSDFCGVMPNFLIDHIGKFEAILKKTFVIASG
jgi:hypothetical protein